MPNPKVSIIDSSIGRYMVYSTNDALGITLLARGVHELSVLQVSQYILSNSDRNTVLDIGANMGAYGIPMGLNFPQKKVVSFEIQKNIFYQLCGNIFLNSLQNVEAINKGVSSREGTVDIPAIDYAKCHNIGGYSIDKTALGTDRIDFPNSSIIGQEKADLITLDSFGENLADVALIKLDIEGHEIEALRGGTKFLKKSGYPPIIFECWSFDWFKQNREELFRYLHEIGYSNISGDIGEGNYLAQSPATTHKLFVLQDNVIRTV